MGADRVDLGDDPDRNALFRSSEGGPLAGEPGPYDEYIVAWHEAGCYRAEIRPGSRDSPNPSHITSCLARAYARRLIVASASRMPSATEPKSTFSARSFGQ